MGKKLDLIDGTEWIDPRSIKIARKNPGARTSKNQGWELEKIVALRRGIQQDGLLHSLVVYAVEGQRELVAGERRLRCIIELLDQDKVAAREGEGRVLCKNLRNGKVEPALVVYETVECKITTCSDPRERKRLAIKENTLHEGLTDYEILLQVDDLEKEGYTRPEQADTLGVSEAHISQSHTLLGHHPKILQYLREDKLTRTAAIAFINIPKDKVEASLDRAVAKMFEAAEKKEQEADKEMKQALGDIEVANDQLTIADFTNNEAIANKARRTINKAEKKVEEAGAKKKKAQKDKKHGHISVDGVIEAASEVEGAADNLKRPKSMKKTRDIYREIADLLGNAENGSLVRPDTKQKLPTIHVSILHKTLGWILSEEKAVHPLDLLLEVG